MKILFKTIFQEKARFIFNELAGDKLSPTGLRSIFLEAEREKLLEEITRELFYYEIPKDSPLHQLFDGTGIDLNKKQHCFRINKEYPDSIAVGSKIIPFAGTTETNGAIIINPYSKVKIPIDGVITNELVHRFLIKLGFLPQGTFVFEDFDYQSANFPRKPKTNIEVHEFISDVASFCQYPKEEMFRILSSKRLGDAGDIPKRENYALSQEFLLKEVLKKIDEKRLQNMYMDDIIEELDKTGELQKIADAYMKAGKAIIKHLSGKLNFPYSEK